MVNKNGDFIARDDNQNAGKLIQLYPTLCRDINSKIK